MTEEKIEKIYERTMDKLDHEFTNDLITEDDYNGEVKQLDLWIRELYSARNCGND
jgi:hypothetical protein